MCGTRGQVTLKVVRAISWRIVTYNKGAFAAMMLITTVVIGVIDFAVKTGRPK